MANPIEWEMERRDGVDYVRVFGELVDEADLGNLAVRLRERVVLDLSGITRINSWGVREWLDFVTYVGKSGIEFTLERCSLPIVVQLNLISDFVGKGRVKSILGPYFCKACNKRFLRPIELDGPDLPALDVPQPCPSCSTPATFDDLPEMYLSFLKG